MASLMMRYYCMTKGPQKPILVHSNISFFVQKLPYTTLAALMMTRKAWKRARRSSELTDCAI